PSPTTTPPTTLRRDSDCDWVKSQRQLRSTPHWHRTLEATAQIGRWCASLFRTMVSQVARLGRLDSGRRAHIRFAGIHVHWHRNVLMHDAPIASRFAINVGHAHRHIDCFPFRVSTADMLNAMAVRLLPACIDRQIADRDFDRSLEHAEESLPVLTIGVSADILPWRNDVEDEQIRSGRI